MTLLDRVFAHRQRKPARRELSRRLTVAAFDERGMIGQGIHERFIVTDERFLAKTAKKLEG